MQQVSSSADLRSVRLEQGRGYRSESVDAFRSAAINLSEALERRIGQLQDAVDHLRTELATTATGPSLQEMLRNADPEIVKIESSQAAGEILALAVDAADRHRSRAQVDVSAAKSTVVDLLEEVVELAKAGRHPDYELHRLVLTCSRLIEQMSA